MLQIWVMLLIKTKCLIYKDNIKNKSIELESSKNLWFASNDTFDNQRNTLISLVYFQKFYFKFIA